MNVYFTLAESHELEPHHRIQFCVIPRTPLFSGVTVLLGYHSAIRVLYVSLKGREKEKTMARTILENSVVSVTFCSDQWCQLALCCNFSGNIQKASLSDHSKLRVYFYSIYNVSIYQERKKERKKYESIRKKKRKLQTYSSIFYNTWYI